MAKSKHSVEMIYKLTHTNKLTHTQYSTIQYSTIRLCAKETISRFLQSDWTSLQPFKKRDNQP